MSESQDKHYIPVEIQKAATSDGDATFVMSAASPDRVADTISPEAWKPNLSKKLIALWQHSADKPIGFWDSLEVKGDKLIGKLTVAKTNLGQMIKQLIADGVPLSASIGFRGEGKPNKQGGFHFEKMDLLECSVVSVPAHPRAVMLAKSYGFDPSQVIEADPPKSGHIEAADAANHHQGRAVLEKAMSVLTRDY